MKKHLFFVVTIFCLMGGGILEGDASCHTQVAFQERLKKIPNRLLSAVALVESGRSKDGGVRSWPWSINANGKPYIFRTKYEAIAKVKSLQREGIKSIDVGCMQINLKHHPKAFKTLSDAFDPDCNVAYGAKLLQQLRYAEGNWEDAVGRYHSATPTYGDRYKRRVMQMWGNLRSGKTRIAGETPQLYRAVQRGVFTSQHNKAFNTHIHRLEGKKTAIKVAFNPVEPKEIGIAQAVPKSDPNIAAPPRIAPVQGFISLRSKNKGSQVPIRACLKMRKLQIDTKQYVPLKGSASPSGFYQISR